MGPILAMHTPDGVLLVKYIIGVKKTWKTCRRIDDKQSQQPSFAHAHVPLRTIMRCLALKVDITIVTTPSHALLCQECVEITQIILLSGCIVITKIFYFATDYNNKTNSSNCKII